MKKSIRVFLPTKSLSFLCILLSLFVQSARADLLDPTNPSSPLSPANPNGIYHSFYDGSSSDAKSYQDPIPANFDSKSCKPFLDDIKRKGMSLAQLQEELSKSKERYGTLGGSGMALGTLAGFGTVVLAGGAALVSWPIVLGALGTAAVFAGSGYSIYKSNQMNGQVACVAYAIRSGMNFNLSDSRDPSVAVNESKAQISSRALNSSEVVHQVDAHSAQ